jgi:hypothetical protein
MKIEELLLDITKKFIAYWNDWNFESLKKYLRDDVVVYSPNIQLIYPENTSGKIEGKDNVIKYWFELQKNAGSYVFTLESFHKEGNSVYTISHIEGRAIKLYTWYIYNEYGKITELKFEYK